MVAKAQVFSSPQGSGDLPGRVLPVLGPHLCVVREGEEQPPHAPGLQVRQNRRLGPADLSGVPDRNEDLVGLAQGAQALERQELRIARPDADPDQAPAQARTPTRATRPAASRRRSHEPPRQLRRRRPVPVQVARVHAAGTRSLRARVPRPPRRQRRRAARRSAVRRPSSGTRGRSPRCRPARATSPAARVPRR